MWATSFETSSLGVTGDEKTARANTTAEADRESRHACERLPYANCDTEARFVDCSQPSSRSRCGFIKSVVNFSERPIEIQAYFTGSNQWHTIVPIIHPQSTYSVEQGAIFLPRHVLLRSAVPQTQQPIEMFGALGDGTRIVQSVDEAINTAPSSSASDRERTGEQWQHRNEQLLYEWLGAWRVASESHAIEHETFQRWQGFLAVPSVVLPLIFSPLASVPMDHCATASKDAVYTAVVTGCFTLCACIAAINAYCSWGVTAEKHLTSSKCYGDLVSDAEEILRKARKDRPDASVILRTLKMKSDHLLEGSPCLNKQHRDAIRKAANRPYNDA